MNVLNQAAKEHVLLNITKQFATEIMSVINVHSIINHSELFQSNILYLFMAKTSMTTAISINVLSILGAGILAPI